MLTCTYIYLQVFHCEHARREAMDTTFLLYFGAITNNLGLSQMLSECIYKDPAMELSFFPLSACSSHF